MLKSKFDLSKSEMANLRIKVGLVGVLSSVALVLSLQKFVGVNLTEYSTQLAVGITLIAIGIGYWTFKPEIERVTSKIAVQETEENNERAEQHRKKLNEAFLIRRSQIFANVYTQVGTFQAFADAKQFLQHLCTGHPELYEELKNLMTIELEIKKMPKPIPQDLKSKLTELKQKEENGRISVRQKFDDLQSRIRQETEDIGGICENCIKFQNPNDKKLKEMKSRLDSFTMPF